MSLHRQTWWRTKCANEEVRGRAPKGKEGIVRVARGFNDRYGIIVENINMILVLVLVVKECRYEYVALYIPGGQHDAISGRGFERSGKRRTHNLERGRAGRRWRAKQIKVAQNTAVGPQSLSVDTYS